MTGAEAFAKCLEKEGVEVIFGYPGAVICPFFDAVLDTKMKTVLVRQEQNAAHEASGYARISGKVGVAVATSGPGAINLMTGIATAFADSIPLVCITGQVDSSLMGTDGFQEADVAGAVESFVKYSYIVSNPDDIPEIIKEAFYIAGSGRKGPVLIDLPFDMQTRQIEKFAYPESVNLRTYKPTVTGHAVQIRKVIRELESAKCPLILAGGGVHLSDAVDDIREFVSRRKIPIVSTMMGLGVMPTEDPYYFGMVGNNGQVAANMAMKEADMIIMVGARVADRTIRDPNLISENKILVHIDIDPAEIGKNAGPTIPIVGDISHIFKEFNREKPNGEYGEWAERLAEKRAADIEKRMARVQGEKIDPRCFIRQLSLAMKEDAIYAADVGQNQLWSCANCVIRKGRFMTSGGMGTMGYALPAAMGAKIAAPSKQVVAVCGDGAFQMTMMELATAQHYRIPVKLVIMKNNTLGLVRQYQHFNFQGHYTVTNLEGGPNLSALAEAYDMDYLKLEKTADTEEIIRSFLQDKKSVILECDVDPDIWA